MLEGIGFYTQKAPCKKCEKSISWLSRICPHCGCAYPTCQKFLYWAGIVIAILGIPAMALGVCLALGMV